GEERTLELADRKAADAAPLEAAEPDRRQRSLRFAAHRRRDAAAPADASPEAEQHGIEDGDGEIAVHLDLLRQIGDVARRRQNDLAFDRAQQPDDGLEESALAGAVRTDDRRQR